MHQITEDGVCGKNNTALQKKILKYTIDEYDHVFWDEESENRIRFHPSHLDFAVPEVTIFSIQRNPEKLFSGNKWPSL